MAIQIQHNNPLSFSVGSSFGFPCSENRLLHLEHQFPQSRFLTSERSSVVLNGFEALLGGSLGELLRGCLCLVLAW